MSNVVEVRKTYKYRLYRNNKVNGLLHHQINVAGIIWNHAIALQRCYYKLTGKYIPLDVMKKHIAKLRMRCPQYAYWKDLGSQAVQEVLERLDKAYMRFFTKKGGLPHFKKVKGSNNHKAGMWHINRGHIRISDSRLDFHFQLAHDLCDQYDVMVFEDLNLDAIKRLWGDGK